MPCRNTNVSFSSINLRIYILTFIFSRYLYSLKASVLGLFLWGGSEWLLDKVGLNQDKQLVCSAFHSLLLVVYCHTIHYHTIIMKLQHTTAVITGVSGGIGLSLCQQLLAKGVRVFGLGRNNVLEEHEQYRFIPTDVRQQEQVDQAFDTILSQTNSAVDILVNNAGLGYFGYLEDLPVDHWKEMYDTNVHGIFYCTRRVLKGMKDQKRGHIVNISSIAGLEGYPQVAGYCSTKFAVRGLSDSLYKEVRDFGVKVTCVYPGSVKTDFFRNSASIQPHDYMLMPDDVAACIVHALETPDNFHQVNLEIRPLMPKGPITT
jgi:NADP-dependent 3-hydroxy acid dehydrogenase YdfG